MRLAATHIDYDPERSAETAVLAATDPLPSRVRNFVNALDDGRELLQDFHRHVQSASRAYPDAYFALGRRTPDALVDLAHRVFATCSRVSKGRFPFLGRPPFTTYVEEQFDGRTIRYHSFYAKLSITREILRADYEHNLASHPMLRWRANLYRDVGLALRRVAVAPTAGAPVRWSVPTRGPTARVPVEHLASGLRALKTQDLDTLIRDALVRGGALTQAQLTWVLEAVLPVPEAEEPPGPSHPSLADHIAVRQTVLGAWHALDDEARALMGMLAEGLQYDEIVQRDPRFKHKVAVNRAVAKCTKEFVDAIGAAMGSDAPDADVPARVAEAVIEVLVECVPELRARLGAHGGSP